MSQRCFHPLSPLDRQQDVEEADDDVVMVEEPAEEEDDGKGTGHLKACTINKYQ